MAQIIDWTEEQKKLWAAWVAERPDSVRALCERLPPNKLYRMKSTGNRVTLVSYGEDGTVRVAVTGEYNAVIFEREVFGVDANDLEECDMPAPDEPVGTMFRMEKEIAENE